MNIELARQQMVQQQVRTWDVFDTAILSVLSSVPREQFVPAGLESLAFAETELPLPHGQLMMTPNVEGRMLQALDIKPSDKVLEIGTGSGFITACLARLAKSVTSIDLYEDFQKTAAADLADSGIKAIWNFSPTRLSSPSEVLIRNEHISLGLAQVAYHLNGLREDDTNSLPTLDQPCKEPCRPMDE